MYFLLHLVSSEGFEAMSEHAIQQLKKSTGLPAQQCAVVLPSFAEPRDSSLAAIIRDDVTKLNIRAHMGYPCWLNPREYRSWCAIHARRAEALITIIASRTQESSR